jgi:hypothetical protein
LPSVSNSAWAEVALDQGKWIPQPGSLDALRENPDYAGWIFAVITLDPAWLDDTVERVNITLPRRVLKRLDALAEEAGQTRSGTIAQLTLHGIPIPAKVAHRAGASRRG